MIKQLLLLVALSLFSSISQAVLFLHKETYFDVTTIRTSWAQNEDILRAQFW